MSVKKTALPLGIIALAVVIGFGAAGCKNDDDSDSNNNGGTPNSTSSAYKWYGNGSANSFTISNATQLAEFAKIVRGTTGLDGPAQSDFKGKTVTLSADINLNNQEWVSIGNYSFGWDPFSGTFDGNDKTISGFYFSNLYTSSGLFGCVGEGGIVKNIVLADINVNGGEYSGAMVGVNRGTVQNCNVTGSINGSVYGGMVGVNRGTVQNCSFSGSVTAPNAGGMVGENHGTVQNCSFSGNVTVSWTSGGGIVGHNKGMVQYCYATGSVDGSSTSAGGIVGYSEGTIRNCYATNNVKGYNWVGGVAGRNVSGTVQNCYATGNITAISNTIDRSLGGVVGRSSDSGTVQNCVALNSSLNITNYSESTFFASRVVGVWFGSISNNYGLSGMTLPGGFNATYGSDGADVSAPDYNSQEWWTTASNWDSASLWNFTTVWEWDSARDLPELRMQ